MADAVFSPDRLYRYALTRDLQTMDRVGPATTVAFLMLNPSTADEKVNDPTIRRCLGFATAWGFCHLTIVNLFAWRSTDPRALAACADPTGPHNDGHIKRAAKSAGLVVAAWGGDRIAVARGRSIRAQLEREGVELHHLGLTKHGHPRHPLYLRGDTKPTRWEAP